MMMQNPDDNLFKDLLSDYAAPVAEDGFSESVLKAIDLEARKVERIRRVSIYGACFVGGAIAASQFPALIAMAAKFKLAVPTLPQIESFPLPYWSLAGLVVLGFVLWAAVDRKASDIF